MIGTPALARGAARARRWPYAIWGVGAAVYLLAVFHRTSLGVAGPLAVDRLQISAGQLSTFVMLQLGVYAAMQVPTGILVDRFGPRRMLLAATLLMGTAQLAFAFVESYPLALLARGLLGVGDAMTYVSVLRLIAGWFPARRFAVLTTCTGLVGMTGNLLATVPLTLVLGGLGWGPTFAIAGGISLSYALLLLRPAVAAPYRERGTDAAVSIPGAEDTGAYGPVGGHRVLGQVRKAWRHPAGRLGFWIHFSAMAGPTAFAVLWAFPYLTQGLGYPPQVASWILLLLVAGGVVANLVIGPLLGRRPALRSPLALAVAVACLTAWLVLVGWPGGHPPTAVVIAVFLVLSVGGPASAVAFMLARDYNPRHRISTATGVVNVGGFCGAVIGVFAVGQVLDMLEPGAATHSLGAFRWALLSIAALTAFGIWRMTVWLLRTRSTVLTAAAKGERVPVSLVPHWFDRGLPRGSDHPDGEPSTARPGVPAAAPSDG